MKIKKWLQTKRKEERPGSQNVRSARATFLHLPGELRNQIYAYTIYPNMGSILLVNCNKPEHFGATILHLPIFRTCRQIRAETLSYLCATFQLRFFGIHSAVVFFSLAGKAAAEIRSLVVIRPVLVEQHYEESKETVERFFSVLETMSELSEMQLEKLADWTMPGQRDAKLEFARRLGKLRERHVAVRVR
ncbi:hypothetical protein COCCADRAFT_32254 [Bipolaris zeicola 26-R-13]|uniref:Uncharacterized protein n=1 Tax=Cochliobolus carbonum (strain 26-R-13) TaxID=930089 RepID=W6YT47_COCC2|nr:uncharacterized protein COCCADRAFT_32254 [Bipolaris zeicola 26-R-13]EUC38594.1 hypothetical protein COCCADRAFT_32254 [Bipolaris zeicola 26-R-13]